MLLPRSHALRARAKPLRQLAEIWRGRPNRTITRGGLPGSLHGLWDRQPDPKQSFENFVVGPETEFAFKAARRFAESSENDMGLLFVHGGFGYGKTHLLNAIAMDAGERNARVLLSTRRRFHASLFGGAAQSRNALPSRKSFAAPMSLLIDDLQHICGRAATVSEFLHTVNAFTDLRRRVVIAADRPPAALEGLTGDVRSRMQGGVIISLQKPDAATRLEILRAKSSELVRKRPRSSLPDEVLSYVATELDVCPRELLGVLVKLATYADLTGKPVTVDVAEEAINSRGAILDRRVTIEEIQKKTAEFYKLDLRELHSARRARRVARSASSCNVFGARADQSIAARYWQALRRPRSHDSSACLPANRSAVWSRSGLPTGSRFPEKSARARYREPDLLQAPPRSERRAQGLWGRKALFSLAKPLLYCAIRVA